MLRRIGAAIGIAVCMALVVKEMPAQRNKKKYEEPKPQILPLPPNMPMALATETASLDFHISPLLKTGGLSAQIRRSLNDLIRDTHGETIVKLRAFVAGAGDARRVEAETGAISPFCRSGPWTMRRHKSSSRRWCRRHARPIQTDWPL